jgi:hypothetical protein
MGSQEAAWYLGFAASEIPILISSRVLKPLGRPAPNGIKYFAGVTLAKVREDAQWLGRASDAISRHWQLKNARRTRLQNGSHRRERQGRAVRTQTATLPSEHRDAD